MASWLFSLIQSLSSKILDAISGSEEDPKRQNQTKSTEEDLKWLSRMLERIEAVQQDAEEREIRDQSVELWLRELRGVAHEAEDVLDECHYEVLKSIVENRDQPLETNTMVATSSKGKRKLEEVITSSSVAKILISDSAADRIKRIIKRFEEISKAREDLHLREDDGERRISGPLYRPPTSSHIDEKGLFGREKEKEEIINLLNTENGPSFVVVPVVGKGGLGKTTLAQLVYNDYQFCRLFEKKAWVSVSEDFDLVRLTRAAIESISGKPCLFSELCPLQDELKKMLNGIKLFLVLDDVWNEENDIWERFRVVFSGAQIVRILTTTRSYSVARVMQTASPFELGHLQEEKCWMLFKYCVFNNQEASEHANLLEIGRHIVKKCNGLPLAVKVLGGLLRYETSEEKWKDVLDSDTWAIYEKKEIMRPLSLSYHHMPSYLRPCFLYLSVYPKDRRFDKEEVITLWMAQGYITSRSNKTLEDVGDKYFEELRGRSVIDSLDGGYVLHDLIHDLAKSINERIYPTFKNENHWDSSFDVYHLYLNGQNAIPDYVAPNNQRSIRTLLDYRSGDYESCDNPIFLKMSNLRVLELKLEHYWTNELWSFLPDDIGILKHLRFLRVEAYYLKYLPESLCLLYNLQTLYLSSGKLEELPENIGNLLSLRHLTIFSWRIEHLPDSISDLCNLRTLKIYAMDLEGLPNGIGQLTNLCELKLGGSLIDMPLGLSKLTNLQTLKGGFYLKGDAMHGGFGELKHPINLGKYVCIHEIRNITDVEFIREANLKSKSGLEYLDLIFDEDNYSDRDDFRDYLDLTINKSSSGGYFTNFKEIEESVLDSLQPHRHIKKVGIYAYGGTRWPSWIGDPLSMPKLTDLFLSGRSVEKCSFLPSLGLLPSLRVLHIRKINVEIIGSEFCRDGSSNIGFPALKILALSCMFELKEWIGVLDDDFPYLKELYVESCHNLRRLPIFKNELEKLVINNCGFHEIQLPISFNMKDVEITNCNELISVVGLNNHKPLANLTLSGCYLLTTLDIFLLSTTTNVKINGCIKLLRKNLYYYQNDCRSTWSSKYSYQEYPDSSFSMVCANVALGNPLTEGIVSQKCVYVHLPQLVNLEISKPWIWGNNFGNLKSLLILGFPKLRHWEGMPTTVEYLEVARCHELVTIPPLENSTRLREIRISECPKLNAIMGLHCLLFLTTLFLEDCQNLRVLPNEKLQIEIQTVQIYNCPLMMDWCQLNGISQMKWLHCLTGGEGSSSMVDSTKAHAEDLDTSRHL